MTRQVFFSEGAYDQFILITDLSAFEVAYRHVNFRVHRHFFVKTSKSLVDKSCNELPSACLKTTFDYTEARQIVGFLFIPLSNLRISAVGHTLYN